mgnify:FL=1
MQDIKQQREQAIESVLNDYGNLFPICFLAPEILERVGHLYNKKNHKLSLVMTLNNAFFRKMKKRKKINWHTRRSIVII